MKETMSQRNKLSRPKPQPQIGGAQTDLSAWTPDRSVRSMPAGLQREDGEYVSLEALLQLLWRQRRVLVISLLSGLVLAGILYKAQPKMYQAKATLEVQLPNDDYMNHRQLDPSLATGSNLMEPYLQTQLRLIQSDAILGRAAAKMSLAENREFLPVAPWWKKFTTAEAASSATPAVLPRVRLMDDIRTRLDARVLFNTQIIQIAFEAEDPKLAADFANTIAEQYQALSVDRKVEAVNQTGDLLGQQIADAQRGLAEAEKRLQDYVSTSGLLSGGDKDSVAEQRLRQLQISLTAAQDARITDQARYEEAMAAAAKDGGDGLESDSLRAYRMRITELRQQIAQNSEVLQPTHYKVRELQAQLNEVEQAFERERVGTVRRLNSQFQASQARESALNQDYERQVGRASREMTNSVRYASLKSDVETHQHLYSSLVERSKEAGVLSAMRASNVKVVDAAEIPYLPIRPLKQIYAAVGLGAGLLPGLLIAFARDRRQQRPRPATSSLQPLGLRSLGVVPHFEPSTATEEVELASWTSPQSEFAQVIEGASHFLFPRGAWPRVVGISSPHNGAGKTTVACNLAIEIARTGKSVLLVDADHHTPRIHEIFGIDNLSGFTDMAGAAPGTETGLVSAWVTRIPNLAVLSCGQGRLTMPGRFDEVVDALRSEFDAVIVDLPAVLADDVTISAGNCLDSMAVVISSEYTTPQSAELAVRRLTVARAPLVGAIFNKVSQSRRLSSSRV